MYMPPRAPQRIEGSYWCVFRVKPIDSLGGAGGSYLLQLRKLGPQRRLLDGLSAEKTTDNYNTFSSETQRGGPLKTEIRVPGTRKPTRAPAAGGFSLTALAPPGFGGRGCARGHRRPGATTLATYKSGGAARPRRGAGITSRARRS